MKPKNPTVINNIAYLIVCFFCVTPFLAQPKLKPDATHIKAQITLDTISKSVQGRVGILFNATKASDTLVIDARNMTLKELKVNNSQVPFKYDNKQIRINSNSFRDGANQLTFSYHAMPKKALYFVGWDNQAPNEIWTQGQGKYTSNWLPSFDDENEKVIFELTIAFNSNYQVLSNGVLTNKQTTNNLTTWTYAMNHPMSSYLLALVVGDYEFINEKSASGVPLYNYYHKQDSSFVEPTFRYSKRIFDTLENEIGIAFPWEIYRQVPVHDFMYAGMENTTLTIFSDTYLRPAQDFDFSNYVNVNAHELAHQWFGDMVTAASGTHHWLQEGFATYYALLAEKAIFGADYFYKQLFNYVEELKTQEQSVLGSKLLDPKASSITFYKKGAWALHVLRDYVGDKAFKTAVKDYLGNNAFKNASTKDFLASVNKVTPKNLDKFIKQWLQSDLLPQAQIDEYLKANSITKEWLSIKAAFSIIDLNKSDSCQELRIDFENRSDKVFWLNNLPECVCDFDYYLDYALKVEDHQLLLAALNRVNTLNTKNTAVLKSNLLDYPTVIKERLLVLLYQSNTDLRQELLYKTASIKGRGMHTFRILWLVLSMNIETNPDNLQTLYKELINYSSAAYHPEVRQLAFEYLSYMNLVNEEVKSNLMAASNHYNWRFKSFAKKMLSELE